MPQSPQPDKPDNNLSPIPDPDLFQTTIQSFKDLPPLLKLGGSIAVLLIFGLALFGAIPDALLWIPVIAIIAFLIYAYMQFSEEKAKRQYELDKQAQEHRHQQEMAQLSQHTPNEPLAPQPEANPTPNPSETLPPATLETLYLQEVCYRCGWISTTAFDPKARHSQVQKLHLASVFTELDVPRADRAEQMALQRGNHDMDRRQTAAVEEIEKEMRQPVLASLSRHPQLVLRGKAGSGKSTLVNYIALCLAGEKLGQTNFNLSQLAQKGWDLPGLLPVRVVLRDYAARGLPAGQSLWQFLTDELARLKNGRDDGTLAPYALHLEQTLKTKGGLLLLDGYDEVPEAHQRREQLQKAILDFQRHFSRVRIVVTSRPYAYEDGSWELPGFASTELLEFSLEQIDHYIEQWYKAMAAADPNLTAEQANEYTQQLQTEIKDNPNLRELAPRPLLLALMSLLHRSRHGAELPQDRHQLYEESVDLLLDFWEQPKRTYDAQGKPIEEKSALIELGIPKHELRAVLNQIAYEVHQEQPELTGTADIPERTLVGLLFKAPSRKPEIPLERIIAYIKNRTGLLEDQGPDQQGAHVYTFPHRTFQEYLAACYLSGPTFPQQIARLARQQQERWREALLLAAARANTPYSVWGLVGKLCPTKPAPKVADAATPPAADWWGAFLAGQVLLETKLTDPVTDDEDKARRQRVKEWHKAIVQTGALPPRDRAQAGNALAKLGDDRPGILACDEMRFCTVPAGPFWLANWDEKGQGVNFKDLNKPYWIGQYPVTAAQFREFLADKKDHKLYALDRIERLPANWPVVWVNWYDALAFANWLDERWRKKKWLPDDYRVMLPNEAEWEKAARGGLQIPAAPQIVTAVNKGLLDSLDQMPSLTASLTTNARAGQELSQRTYPWGNEPEQEAGLYRANNETAGIGQPCAVGSFPAGASPYGCLDMSGQVWEWTRSYYGKKFSYQLEAKYETIDDSNKERMVLRGGAYYRDQNVCSVRNRSIPRNSFLNSYGVRVCVSPFLTADL